VNYYFIAYISQLMFFISLVDGAKVKGIVEVREVSDVN
jgi:hypothetical protein